MARKTLMMGAGLAIAASMTFAAAGQATADPVQAVVSADNRLGLALFDVFAKAPKNVVLSPLSVGTAVSMALAGARGTTESEMEHALDVRISARENAEARRQLMAAFNRPNDKNSPQFVSANALMLTKFGDLVSPAYKQMLAQDFGAELFAGASLSTINGWVKNKTHGRIPTILSRLDPNSVCVLLNAVYFKGAWASRFNKKTTTPAPFHLVSDEAVQVPMMRQTASFRVLRAHEFDAIALPYQNSTLAMIVLLPMSKGMAPLSALGAETASSVVSGLEHATYQHVDLSLPRFTVTSGGDLVPPLKALGIKLAFDRDRADFSGITGSTDQSKRIHISQARTRAYVAVDEEGTEAAGATAIEFGTKSIRPPAKPTVFRVDRPFVFLIADMSSGALLFVGRVLDPRASD